MPKPMLKRATLLIVVLGLWMLTGWLSSAEAVLTIKVAEVQNGVAVVQGSKAPANAPISWEGSQVTQANKAGNFAFQGVVPADCVGRLEDGVPADAIDVALANCTPVSGPPAAVEQTGQTVPSAPGDDGDLQAGVAWPIPRFTDHGDGTVTDQLTGLIWLKQANCFTPQPWANALSAANNLASGSCGLMDGSQVGDWRLPNVKELLSLISYGQFAPALPAGHPFAGVLQFSDYWSSTTRPDNQNLAWYVSLTAGEAAAADKVSTFSLRVWPVRGGN